MAGNINEFHLIKLVESYPIIYDKNESRSNKARVAKSIAWNQISQQVGAPEQACITRWKSLKDRFCKELRSIQKMDVPTCWEPFTHLLFLKSYYNYSPSHEQIPAHVRKKTKQAGNHLSSDKLVDVDPDPKELMLNQQLIALVKEHPVLYHKQQIRNSRNLARKNEAWCNISNALGISEEEAYKRWKKLRDRFARKCRYHQLYPEKPITWIYFPDLIFLEDHYRKGIPLPVAEIRSRYAGKEILDINYYEHDNEDDDFDDVVLYDEYATTSRNHLIKEKNVVLTNNEINIEQTLKPKNKNSTDRPSELNSVHEKQLAKVANKTEDVLRTKVYLGDLQSQQPSTSQQKRSWLEECFELLLNGLSNDQRSIAENTVFNFISESQVRYLNNETVEDVINTNIV